MLSCVNRRKSFSVWILGEGPTDDDYGDEDDDDDEDAGRVISWEQKILHFKPFYKFLCKCGIIQTEISADVIIT